jgi:hypothetical protein
MCIVWLAFSGKDYRRFDVYRLFGWRFPVKITGKDYRRFDVHRLVGVFR